LRNRAIYMQKIGVVTAGGDAPGMNVAILSVVRTAIFNGLKVVGIERGHAGLIEEKIRPLNARSVSGIIKRVRLLKEVKKRMVGVKGKKIVSVDLDCSWQQKKSIDEQLYSLAEILSA